MTLAEIKSKLSTYPTMMGLDAELEVLCELMTIEDDVVLKEFSLFYPIMDDMLVSRSWSFYEISEKHKPTLLSFSSWLKHLGTLFTDQRREGLEDLARIYAEFPI